MTGAFRKRRSTAAGLGALDILEGMSFQREVVDPYFYVPDELNIAVELAEVRAVE